MVLFQPHRGEYASGKIYHREEGWWHQFHGYVGKGGVSQEWCLSGQVFPRQFHGECKKGHGREELMAVGYKQDLVHCCGAVGIEIVEIF